MRKPYPVERRLNVHCVLNGTSHAPDDEQVLLQEDGENVEHGVGVEVLPRQLLQQGERRQPPMLGEHFEDALNRDPKVLADDVQGQCILLHYGGGGQRRVTATPLLVVCLLLLLLLLWLLL